MVLPYYWRYSTVQYSTTVYSLGAQKLFEVSINQSIKKERKDNNNNNKKKSPIQQFKMVVCPYDRVAWRFSISKSFADELFPSAFVRSDILLVDNRQHTHSVAIHSTTMDFANTIEEEFRTSGEWMTTVCTYTV